MNNSKIKILAVAASVLVSNFCMAEMAVKKYVWIKNDMTSFRSDMLTIPVKFIHAVPQGPGAYYSHTCVYVNNDSPAGGRWQRVHQLWDNKSKIGNLIGTWDIRSSDGSEAHSGVAFDAVNAKGEKVVLKVETKQFKDFPNWVFYHYSGCVPPSMAFDCIALRPQNHTQYQRSIWFAWNGGTAECGDKASIPWFGSKHKMIDAFAVYSRGSEKEARECDMAVWIPEQYSYVSDQRFKKNDDRYTFYYTNTAGEYTFALGARTTGSGEKECAPAFLKEERLKVAEKLRSIDWTLKADAAAVKAKYEEVKKLAGDNADAAKVLPAILTDIESNDAIRIVNADAKLDQMKKTLAGGKLNDLFE